MSTEGPAVNAFFPLLVLFLFLFLLTNIPLHETIDIYINQLFETLILLKVSQSQNLMNCDAWPQKSPILYLTVYFTNKPMV